MKNDISTPDGKVSWGVVKDLYYYYENNKSVRLCPKLSDIQVCRNDFDKQKVRLATQVSTHSHSCSAAIKTIFEADPTIFENHANKAMPKA